MNISVIVPFYNAEKYIADCIEALLKQRYPTDRYEILMVDNNSADRSAEIVKQFPRVKVLVAPKQGAYAARNRAIASARGEIIAFTDADCVPVSNWLAQIAAAMQQPDVDIVIGPRQFANHSLALSLLADYETAKAAAVFSSKTKEIYYGYTNNMAVRKSLFEQIGTFSEIDRGADTLFVSRAVNTYSCDVVRYMGTLSVKHLEIRRVRDYYKKRLVYGRSNQHVSKHASYRPLSNRERFQVFRRTMREGRYGFSKSVLLFLLLVPGALCYEIAQQQASHKQKSITVAESSGMGG